MLALRTAQDLEAADEALASSDSDDDEDIYGPPPPASQDVTFEAVLARQMATESIFQEDPPERVDANNPLAELPDTNDKNYPQENKAYFEKKNYCRTDKYDLEDFVCNGVDLPSLEKLF